ncbi:Uncharacterized protein Fot_03891 [Forsythia ovata]|uniref:Uncharacterized protein n=1 Tax=Forsythia ovata TaxID=205694 RepID=A0ABD1XB02_9LAMI
MENRGDLTLTRKSTLESFGAVLGWPAVDGNFDGGWIEKVIMSVADEILGQQLVNGLQGLSIQDQCQVKGTCTAPPPEEINQVVSEASGQRSGRSRWIAAMRRSWKGWASGRVVWRSQLATIGDLGEEEGVRGLTCQGRGLGNHTSWRNHRPEEVTGSAEIDVSRLKAEAENAGMKAVEKYRANFHMSPDYEGMMDIF